MDVSAVLIVKDGERHLDRVLVALAWCSEVLVLDSGSTDATLAICARHGVRVEHQPFLGYGPQKRRAVALARHDWVLVIDDDEVVNDEAVAAIRALDGGDPGRAWRIRRRTFVGRREVRYGQWSPDFTLRLFNRTRAGFNDRAIHESVQPSGKVHTLPGALDHYSYADWSEVFERCAGYARAKAKQYREHGRRAGILLMILRAGWGFTRSYVFKQGFRDGVPGVLVALSVALDGVLGLAMADEDPVQAR